MNDNDSDIGEEEDEMIELNEDEVEEIVFDEGVIEGEEDEPSEEEQEDGNRPEDPSSPIRDDAEFVFKKHTGMCCSTS